MLLNLRTGYASGYELSNAFDYYSESEVLKAFSNEDEYMSAVAKHDSENNAQELTLIKNEIDKTCKLISEKTSENLEAIRENEESLENSRGTMWTYYSCEIYPLQRDISYDSFHQAVLMRESLRLMKMIDRINNCDNAHEYERLSAEIDLLESEATSYRLLGTLNELRYKTDCL